MKNLVFLLFLAFGFLSASAQNNLVQFERMEHDYGKKPEDGGKMDHTFSFKNTSTTPIQLMDVKASCGCTTPKWSKETIQPGATGSIVASYDPKNRPGPFDKTITVRAAKLNAQNKLDSAAADIKILRIKGDIIPRSKNYADFYPFEEGNFRYSSNHIALGDVNKKMSKTKEVTIFNQGNKPITINKVTIDKPHITLNFKNNKQTVNPKDSMHAVIVYDATKLSDQDWDWQHDRIYFETNDDTLARKTLYVSATIKPYFSKEDSLNPAKIDFDKTTHDFGNINPTEKVETVFTFKNNGKSDLKILKSKASCGCTASQPEKTLLKPGEASTIKVTFDPTGKKGDQHKTVTVVSNDPTKDTITLTIKAKIKDETATPATPATPAMPAMPAVPTTPNKAPGGK
jgi:hypothetical protein